jgi:hypothetical protein
MDVNNRIRFDNQQEQAEYRITTFESICYDFAMTSPQREGG